MALDVLVPEEAERLPLHDEVPAMEARLLAESVVGLGRRGPVLARQPAELLAPALQLAEDPLEVARDAGEGGGLLRPQLRLRPRQALGRPRHGLHADDCNTGLGSPRRGS